MQCVIHFSRKESSIFLDNLINPLSLSAQSLGLLAFFKALCIRLAELAGIKLDVTFNGENLGFKFTSYNEGYESYFKEALKEL